MRSPRIRAGSSLSLGLVLVALAFLGAAAPGFDPPARTLTGDRGSFEPASSSIIKRPAGALRSTEGAGSPSYTTGFEPSEGFAPGHLDGQAGWVTFFTSFEEAHIETANPAAGLQHLRITKDPDLPPLFLTGGFSPNLGTQTPSRVTVSVDVAISAAGGARYEVAPQSIGDDEVTTRVKFNPLDTDVPADGLPNIHVLEDLGAGSFFQDTGVNWIPDGQYRRLHIDVDPGAGTIDYYYDGAHIYTGNAAFAQTVEEVVILSNNDQSADEGDFDNLVIRSVGENELIVETAPGPCLVEPQLVIEIWMRHLTQNANGFQAFLEFDDATLAFDAFASSYTVLPFPLHFQEIDTAEIAPGTLRLDGTDGFNGPGTDADALLATLVFDVVGECEPSAVLFDLTQSFDSELSLNGVPLVTALVDMQPVTPDLTAPTFASFPPDVTIECGETAEPGIPYGLFDGGVAIYYNDNGTGEIPENQAFLKGQFDGTNDPAGGVNGGAFAFDDGDLVGIPGLLSWQILYGDQGQFGFDFVLPAPTNDLTVPVPPLDAFDNGDNTIAGRIFAGEVTWAINDYKGAAPNGPQNPATEIINSLIRGHTPPDPLTDLVLTTFEVSGGDPVFTALVAGRLVSDDIHHWYDTGTPDSPMSTYLLDGEFFFEGTLSYDSTGDDGTDLIDFYAGTLAMTANSPNLEVGFATAIDNCTPVPVVTFSDVVIPDPGGCVSFYTIERTWRASDACGNATEQLQVISVTDTMPPVISDCPENIVVNAEAGGCDAQVSWTPPTAVDACDVVTLTSNAQPGDIFPVGTTTVMYTAEDCGGNVAMCSFDVTVEPVTEAIVTVELAGSGPATRCIRLVNVDDCAGTFDVTLSFTDHDGDPVTPVRAATTLELACGSTFICAKDEQHTTWTTTGLAVAGAIYEATVRLQPGDTDNDGDVDLIDVSWVVATFGDFAMPGGCPWDGVTRDGDFNNNGAVGSEDYSLQQGSWNAVTDCACAAAAMAGGTPRRSAVPVSELAPWVARRADLNRDGTFDHRDVAIFERKRGLPDDLSRAIRESAARAPRGKRH